MARNWYTYVGGALGDPRLSSGYSLLTTKPACMSGNIICAIYTGNGDISPTTPLSLNLLNYISNANASGVPEPQRPLGAKKFVYLRR
ncbi:hypothetical protein [Pedobacter sp. NJ-S-72]